MNKKHLFHMVGEFCRVNGCYAKITDKFDSPCPVDIRSANQLRETWATINKNIQSISVANGGTETNLAMSDDKRTLAMYRSHTTWIKLGSASRQLALMAGIGLGAQFVVLPGTVFAWLSAWVTWPGQHAGGWCFYVCALVVLQLIFGTILAYNILASVRCADARRVEADVLRDEVERIEETKAECIFSVNDSANQQTHQ